MKVAKNLTIGIAKETKKHKKQPKIAQIEELFKVRPNEFRYLVYKFINNLKLPPDKLRYILVYQLNSR